ncbi:lysozyme inhibitor LprI family protein [Trinickia acidisoli]|uniref:lysozyme inhibitor LprI family protein n=1 Tax=Trinickia acidisoli TaxID=2767482 RepID=UPI001A8C0D40|nr:lysozyme inhibitor LprI family protein [Trinickia acidisoli]
MSAEKLTKRILFLLAFLSVSAVASAQTLTEELAARSGMSPGAITTLLATCDANQTSMKFCAWRDELAAEHALQQLIAEKRATSPKCGAVLAQKVAAWQKRRDQACRESAQAQWGDGSMLPAEVAMCATDRTRQMTRTLSANSCP